MADRILLPGALSEAQKAWLYRHCDAFLFPSLCEGFGLPVIEAMSCGKPVFVSHATSLPEVGGPHAFYWHDFHPEALARVFYRGMGQVEGDPGYREKAIAHARQFTWEKAAEAYLSLYRDVMGDASRQQIRCRGTAA